MFLFEGTSCLCSLYLFSLGFSLTVQWLFFKTPHITHRVKSSSGVNLLEDVVYCVVKYGGDVLSLP